MISDDRGSTASGHVWTVAKGQFQTLANPCQTEIVGRRLGCRPLKTIAPHSEEREPTVKKILMGLAAMASLTLTACGGSACSDLQDGTNDVADKARACGIQDVVSDI